MGMTASQARLLSITARLSDNEHTGQAVSYSKQRLADQTDQVQQEYNAALSATKLTMLIGFSGTEPQYGDLSYNLLMSPDVAINNKQYVVTDNKGKVLVTNKIANAYRSASGDFNKFLANSDIGYSISDVTLSYNAAVAANPNADGYQAQQATMQKVHDAWDKYFDSVGIHYGDQQHDDGHGVVTFGWNSNGYPVYLRTDNRIQNGVDGNNQPTFMDPVNYTYKPVMKDVYKTDDDGNVVNDNDGNPIVIGQTPLMEDVYKTDSTGQYLDNDGNVTTDPNQYVVIGQTQVFKQEQIDPNDVNVTRDIKVGEPVMEPVTIGGTTYYIQSTAAATGGANSVKGDDGFYYYANLDGGCGLWSTDQPDGSGNRGPIYDPINYEGTTKEQRALYDYAVAITEAFLNPSTNVNNLKNMTDPTNSNMIKYYQNLFDIMQTSGFYTYNTDPSGDPDDVKKKPEDSPLLDAQALVAGLKDGSLRIEYYSATSKGFVSTTLDEDSSIQEVKDDRTIALAETKYQQDMTALENKDKRFDLQLKQLDTEHNALQTEYDSVQNVIKKNIEKTFSMFS